MQSRKQGEEEGEEEEEEEEERNPRVRWALQEPQACRIISCMFIVGSCS